MYGDYLQLQARKLQPRSPFIPPSMYGPPEFVHVDWKDTEDPGLLMKDIGKGKLAWCPGTLAAFITGIARKPAKLLSDLVDSMLPQGQLKSNAHPLVEITFMRQNNSRLMHFINLSGHADTSLL